MTPPPAPTHNISLEVGTEATVMPPTPAPLPMAVNAVAAAIDDGTVVAVLLVVGIGLVASCVAPVPLSLVGPEVVAFNAVASVVNIL